jgi:hypothetical protein
MFVVTPDRKSVVTETELTQVFQEHRDHGNSRCIQLYLDDGASCLSAVGEGFGPYILEWFPIESGTTGTHHKTTEELKAQEVLDAFLDFFAQGSAWRESYSWIEVENEKPPWPARLLGRLFGEKTRSQIEDKPTGVDLEDAGA